MRELKQPAYSAVHSEADLRFPRRIVGWIFMDRVGRPGTGDQDDHGFVAGHREMRLFAFGVKRTDRKRRPPHQACVSRDP